MGTIPTEKTCGKPSKKSGRYHGNDVFAIIHPAAVNIVCFNKSQERNVTWCLVWKLIQHCVTFHEGKTLHTTTSHWTQSCPSPDGLLSQNNPQSQHQKLYDKSS